MKFREGSNLRVNAIHDAIHAPTALPRACRWADV